VSDRHANIRVLKKRRLALASTIAAIVLAFAPDEEAVDLGPGITPPRVIHQVPPITRPDAPAFRVSGTVLIGLVVSSQGEPMDVHPVRSLDKDVDQTAVDAVQQWRFEPGKKGDRPVAVRITVEIRFHAM
jgi:TonB family protein